MRRFDHLNATSIQEATSALKNKSAVFIAGGTDLIGRLKDEILPGYPELIVNLKTIQGLDYVHEEGGLLKIGAGTRLADIAADPIVRLRYTALGQAAGRAASPHIRRMGTLGGNISQLHRCWYFRAPQNRFECLRKGGKTCFALAGDNRYHSIFGAVNGCIAVHPSDTAPSLVALDARIKTTKRTIIAEDFWDVRVASCTVLDTDEIVTEVQIPAPDVGARSAFVKFALRKSIDFPIVNAAVFVGGGAARICLNAVAPKPYRATKAEQVIAGKSIDSRNTGAAGAAAVADSRPLEANRYKVQIAKVLVERALLECASAA